MERSEFKTLMEALVRVAGVRVDEVDMELWWGALHRYPVADCHAALGALMGEGGYINLPNLVAATRTLRAARLTGAGEMPVPAVAPTAVAAYQQWVRVWREAVLGGAGAADATVTADAWAKGAGVYDSRAAGHRSTRPYPQAQAAIGRVAATLVARTQ